MTPHFAIVGSGPSGMYAADALIEGVPGCRVDVYDRMPAPFGLIRYGVAPDHYKTKNTARQFARTLDLDTVRFIGNVTVGRDVTIDELKANYDAVVLAIGAYNDRALGVPGEHLRGVYGACAFVGWYNGHPDYRDLDPLLDRDTVCVVGVGNVALDICRVLAKTADEMRESDIAAHALAAIQAAPLKRLFGLMWLGFWLQVVSGTLLLISYPTKALTNPLFYLKLSLVALAMIVLRKIHARVFGDSKLSEAAVLAQSRALAIGSLCLWVGVTTAGRFLAYYYRYLLFP